jgi:hypothetical protein
MTTVTVSPGVHSTSIWYTLPPLPPAPPAPPAPPGVVESNSAQYVEDEAL